MFTDFLLGLIGGLCAIYWVLCTLITLHLRRARFFFGSFRLEPLPLGSIPPEGIFAVLDSWAIKFNETPKGTYALSVHEATVSILKDPRILAIRGLATISGASNPDSAALLTFKSDGSFICTCSTLGTADRIDLGAFGVRESLATSNLEVLLEHHLLQIDEASQQGGTFRQIPRSKETLEPFLNAVAKEVFATAQGRGDLVPVECPAKGCPAGSETGVFKIGAPHRRHVAGREIADLLRLLGCSSLTLRVRGDDGAIRKAKPNELRLIQIPRTPRKSNKPDATIAQKIKLLVLSGLVFLVVYPGTWNYAFDLLMIVLFHELGHGLAMAWRGYKNITLGFIPGLGGFANGTKDNATVEDRLYVVLGGPIFGLAVAIAVFWATPPEYLRGDALPVFGKDFFLFSAIVNFLNLAPISPLDGGRAVELIFRGRSAVRLVRVFGLVGLVYLLPSLSLFLGLLGSFSLLEYLISRKFVVPNYPVAHSLASSARTQRVSLSVKCRFIALYLSAFLLVVLCLLLFLSKFL